MKNDKRSIRGRTIRGQSETIGFVLLFAMVLIGAGTIITYGAVAVDNSEKSLSADRAEKVMTQMDSEISMVALGRTDSQRMRFDRVSGEQFTVDDSSGTINITTIGNNSEVIMPDTTLGAIKFERGDTVIAYQGGGVWRSDGAGSGMISPPEFNYRDQTLTLPLVTVTGDHSLGREAVVRRDGDSVTYFPNESVDKLSNPLEDDVVQVTVESEYHYGWNTYFETRTEGNVTHLPDEQTVKVNLTAPGVVSFDHGAATTSTSKPESKKNGGILGSTRTDITASSVSPDVEKKISECESDGCKDATSAGSTYDSGTYYTDSDWTVDSSKEFDTSDGDIDVVVDGELKFKGGTDIDITGGGRVNFYLNDSMSYSGTPDINTGGDPEDLIFFAHTDVDSVADGGTPQLTGYIYAPGSDFDIKGSGSVDRNIVGGVVAETVDVQNGVLKHVDPNLRLEIGGGADTLTYLHISTNPVTVSDS